MQSGRHNYLNTSAYSKCLLDIRGTATSRGLQDTWLLTYSTEQSPWEANRFSASQEIPRILWNPKVHYLIHRCPVNCPYPEPARSSPYPPHPTSLRSILILSSHLRLGLPSGLFPSSFATKILYAPLFSPHALHAPPISLFSIWSPEQYWVSRTDTGHVDLLWKACFGVTFRCQKRI